MTRNRMLYIRKNASLPKTALFSAYYIFIATPKQLLTHLRHGRTDLAAQTLKGLWWNFTHSANSSSLGYFIP
ncbi:hypothetical protein LWM68_16185 [Niabella sp. W65]|nr:hypothetical protein [Niabella sp. W65]MCH7364160.1 hypothetical protein [Niabella sp. W65]ULT40036.1 hypothetical protein KRR40_35020 [Niabella sp. I65]